MATIKNDKITTDAVVKVLNKMLETQHEAVASLIDGIRNDEIDINKTIGHIMLSIGQTTNQIKSFLNNN